jgi:hypothetical protein
MEQGRQQSIPLAVSVSSGAGTGLFTKSWNHVNRIRIVPPTEVTEYNVAIKDGDGRLMFSNNIDGETTKWIGTLPIHGPYSLGIINSVEISGSSVDGTFYCILDMH